MRSKALFFCAAVSAMLLLGSCKSEPPDLSHIPLFGLSAEMNRLSAQDSETPSTVSIYLMRQLQSGTKAATVELSVVTSKSTAVEGTDFVLPKKSFKVGKKENQVFVDVIVNPVTEEKSLTLRIDYDDDRKPDGRDFSEHTYTIYPPGTEKQ